MFLVVDDGGASAATIPAMATAVRPIGGGQHIFPARYYYFRATSLLARRGARARGKICSGAQQLTILDVGKGDTYQR